MVDTPINDIDSFTEEQKQKDISNYPLKRYGLPNDVAWGLFIYYQMLHHGLREQV